MILAAVSGGLDSTIMAWRLLTTTDEPLHIHYVSLRSKSGRWKAEDAAMRKIIPWLRAHCRYFDYTTTVRSTSMKIADIAIVSDECARLIESGKIKRPRAFVRGAQANDYADPSLAGRQKAALENWKAHFAGEAPPIEFPVKDITREELVASAPQELIKITWTCRHPRIVNNQFVQCTACKACRELRAAKVPFQRELEYAGEQHAL
jgi:7-cyano-7-deazaguanine synthase in queuosine biosynthesis